MADIVKMKSRRESSSDEDSGRLAKKPRTVHPLTYKSVRIITQGDIDSLYPLIVAYIETPSLADSITDFAIDMDTWPCNIVGSGFGDSNPEVSPHPVEDQLHAAVESYVRDMGLGDGALQIMLPALEWKKRQLRDGVQESRGERARHEKDFATSASAILLALCKNITTLYLGSLGWIESPFQLYMLLSGMNRIPQPGLRNVTRVEAIAGATGSNSEREHAWVSFQKHFNYICRLPALESVVLDGFADKSCVNPHTLPQSASSIKKISIHHADMSSRVIGKLLAVPKHLEELSLSLSKLRLFFGGPSQIFPRTVGEYLSRHRETLRVLDLDMDISNCGCHGYDSESDSDREEGSRHRPNPVSSLVRGLEQQPKPRAPSPSGSSDEAWLLSPSLPVEVNLEHGNIVGSFGDYKSMTHLSIGIKTLLGPTQDGKLAEHPPCRLIDALPPSLEYLRLYGYERGENADIDEHVNEFMEKREERLPLLKEVKGVDGRVEPESSMYKGQDDSTWQRPKRDFGWVKA
ncbi:hypothetical protein B0J13DRAFT_539327 [Dactylonectria estremocensis]|uniref:Uncharacterized protein n=1 Tax=Dactylonectria estremocensis TaxID=1079267 RepID=A0A9P9FDT8_9HYPO|nr:hypothetical protein B0J13DRAFT_539327 [Dactylonectria estremocensis]